MFFDPAQKYDRPAVANAFNVWVDILAPIETLFRFLTDENELGRWWANHCTADPRPGGRLHYVWDGEKSMTGDAVFRQFEPPFRVVIEWTHRNGEPIVRDGGDPRGMRWLPLNIFELAPIGGNAVRLHLHDFGIAAGSAHEELRRATEKGWLEAMARLKKAAERAHWRDNANRAKQRERRKKSDAGDASPEPAQEAKD